MSPKRFGMTATSNRSGFFTVQARARRVDVGVVRGDAPVLLRDLGEDASQMPCARIAFALSTSVTLGAPPLLRRAARANA